MKHRTNGSFVAYLLFVCMISNHEILAILYVCRKIDGLCTCTQGTIYGDGIMVFLLFPRKPPLTLPLNSIKPRSLHVPIIPIRSLDEDMTKVAAQQQVPAALSSPRSVNFMTMEAYF